MKRGTKGGNKVLPCEVGQRVMAQFPGSTTLWYEAKVLVNTGVYKVEFKDGTQHQIPVGGVRPIEEERSRTARRKKSPARSSTRKSPSRSASRSQSPARNRRSSRSPGRPMKQAARATPDRSKETRAVTPTRQSSRMKETVLARERQERDEAERNTARSPSRVEQVDSGSVFVGSRRRVHDASNNNRTPVQVALQKGAVLGSAATPSVMNNLIDTDGKDHPHPAAPQVSRPFGGTIGTVFWAFASSLFVVAINLMCTKKNCTILKMPILSNSPCDWVDLQAAGIYVGWILFQVILQMIPVGKLVEGRCLPNGERLKYRMNGFVTLVVSIAAVGVSCHYRPWVMTFVLGKTFQMLIASLVVSALFSIFLFVKARHVKPDQLSAAGVSSRGFYGFFMGRELNPRLFDFDLKMFLELRPGLIGLAALLYIMVVKDYHDNGTLNGNLAMFAVLQSVYIADALYFEKSVLTTVDITTEGLGFMLTFGNLCFVPFIFGLPARFLFEQRLQYAWYCLPGIAALYMLGYVIFRCANSQKDRFTENSHGPTVCHLATIATGLPNNLLVGGWWGFLRNPNYLGDLIMAASLSLLVGHQHVIPHVYFAYLLVMLVHRALRNDNRCARKYGRAWDEYRRQVPSRIFPKIF